MELWLGININVKSIIQLYKFKNDSYPNQLQHPSKLNQQELGLLSPAVGLWRRILAHALRTHSAARYRYIYIHAHLLAWHDKRSKGLPRRFNGWQHRVHRRWRRPLLDFLSDRGHDLNRKRWKGTAYPVPLLPMWWAQASDSESCSWPT